MIKPFNLLYVPVLHTHRESEDIVFSLKASGGGKHADKPGNEYDKSVKDMWDGIYKKIHETQVVFSSMRIYQDSLPVCGMEREVVSKLAEKGSRNHQLILDLLNNGARIEGTEDQQLLIKEYDCLTRFIASAHDHAAALERYRAESAELMKQRDEFIAGRIKSTLQDGEAPLVFMGVRHGLEELLKDDFIIIYIIYRLPFRKIGDIYNV
ncbi:MAG: hypothetical protein NTX71_09220 [Candidatus Aureabacteria bacterium]|nr:hypothetical protein [Candidatus Auribacterota bacterium]